MEKINPEHSDFSHGKSNVFMEILVDATMESLVGKHGNFLAKNKLRAEFPCLPTKLAILTSTKLP